MMVMSVLMMNVTGLGFCIHFNNSALCDDGTFL